NAPRKFSARTAFRRRTLFLPASMADAAVLGIPNRVDGPRADHGDLSGTLQSLPRGPWAEEALRRESLGLPRRWRNRRAGNAGSNHARLAREARQSDLRHQLQ